MPQTQRMVYAGELRSEDGDSLYGQLFVEGTTAVLLEDRTNRHTVVTDLELSLSADERLAVSGKVDGAPIEWMAQIPARPFGTAARTEVLFADGGWTNASVNWTQYAVTVTAKGKETRVLVGATARTVGGRVYVTPLVGDDIVVKLDVAASCCTGT